MTNYKAFPGFTGSEIERAALSCGVFPVETALERHLKQKLARALARTAKVIDPAVVHSLETRAANAH